MAGFSVCGKMAATAGEGDTLEGYLLEAAEKLRDVAGCHLYLVHRLPDEPDTVWVYEAWEDADAHRASLELDAVRELIARARPIIAGMTDRLETRLVGGKGLPT